MIRLESFVNLYHDDPPPEALTEIVITVTSYYEDQQGASWVYLWPAPCSDLLNPGPKPSQKEAEEAAKQQFFEDFLK